MKIGVVVARFQTPMLHDGHIALLSYAQAKSDRLLVVLGIGSAVCQRDPLSYSLRERMVKEKFSQASVWGLPNHRHDRDWAAALDAFLYTAFPRADVTLYGCRDSCLQQYERYGYNKVEHVPAMDGTKFCNATQLRSEVTELDTSGFRAGVIHGVNSVCPRVQCAVDVALYEKAPKVIEGNFQTPLRVLLVRKQGEAAWRFPGGGVDPEDDNFEMAARRELTEETGLACNSITYVSARRIDDWRFRRTGISVFTTFYAAPYISGFAKPQDREIADTKWVVVNEAIMEVPLVEEHQPLYRDFLAFAKSKSLL